MNTGAHHPAAGPGSGDPSRVGPDGQGQGDAARLPRLIVPRRFPDQRGWFSETWNARRLAADGLAIDFVQDNQSYSAQRGTIRGLHFQAPPHAQGKLVRTLRGRIYDVAVDIRRGSPTYGQFVGAELTAENGHQLWIPVGFAHGFCTLDDDVDVAYKVTDYYAPECEGGLRFDDPDIGIPWPLDGAACVSDKDAVLPGLRGFESPFDCDGVPLRALATG
ncbi:MAG: dTDP-4-dehydrorhamnose 3,5-epimerase [Rhodoplanes sp.]|uniref:dTDP-4-dehydrorhamnose 3,5-epimerase n=1 Tax=Rhodoplanes sp. TaxID=1968906 RepID=UPI0017B7AF07|nr:dTDP-4-dehydrorhamnose 3,5-epimerase [Rhodoplanes sp.]NVO15243.1 dTDP-4-dehydrorhamnose 3,5-epimerase [Rhodoplanes sp.]